MAKTEKIPCESSRRGPLCLLIFHNALSEADAQTRLKVDLTTDPTANNRERQPRDILLLLSISTLHPLFKHQLEHAVAC